MKTLFKLFFTLFIFSSCSDNDFKVYVELKDLRILALVANDGSNKAEVSPGSSVTITPWISDINETSQLTYTWQGCIDPGLNFGVEPSCDQSSLATPITTGTISTLTAAQLFTGAADSFVVTIPSNLLVTATTQQKNNGLNYIVTYSLSNSAGLNVKSFKRIVVSDSSKVNKNSNPVLNSILANDVTLTTLSANSSFNLRIDYPSSSRESYNVLNEKNEIRTETEELQTTWFYTDGEAKYFRTINTDLNTYTTPATYPNRDSLLVAVIRDDRGGTFVQKFLIK